MPLEFEWDSRKALLNHRNHGISFEQAIRAFQDPFAIELIDERENYGEERVNLIGLSAGVLVHVTYTASTHPHHLGPTGGTT